MPIHFILHWAHHKETETWTSKSVVSNRSNPLEILFNHKNHINELSNQLHFLL